MRPSRLPLGLFAGLLLAQSCVGGDAPVAPGEAGRRVSLPIQASVVASAADAAAPPINRIRAVAERVPGGETVDSVVTDVSPTAGSWTLSLSVSTSDPTLVVVVYLQLIHVDASGRETVEYSGRTAPITVVPGGTAEPASVEVVRGPMDNLSVTSVAISGAPTSLEEGDSATLSVQVTTSDANATPVVFWTVLDAGVAGVSAGVVHALLPGTARVVASAGPEADTVSIAVQARPSKVSVTPDTAKVSGPGAEVVFTGHVLDTRGKEIAGQGVLWRSLDPAVAESLGGGRFRSVTAGNGRAEARSAADTTLKGVGVLHVQPAEADLAVTKVASRGSAAEGDTVAFTLEVTNGGPAPATGVTVRDTLPGGLTVVSAQTGAGSVDAAGTTWTIGDLAAGSSVTLTLRTRVEEGAGGRTLVNVAHVTGGPAMKDPAPDNDRATASVAVTLPIADIAVTKTASASTAAEGDTVTFTVAASNAGPADAADVAVIDALPAGLTLVHVSTESGAFDEATGTWTVSLAAGAGSYVRLRTVVGSGTAGSTLVNVARYAGAGQSRDTTSANDQASAAVRVLADNTTADIRLQKTVDRPTPSEGDTVTFTITITNDGPARATNLVVYDTLPTGLDSSAVALPPGITFVAFGTFHVDSLAADATLTATAKAVAAPGTAGRTLTNVIKVLSLDQTDPDVANDQASSQVVVSGAPLDLAVTKSVSPASPVEADTAVFTVRVRNLGSVDATTVVVKDSLLAPYTMGGFTPSQGSFAPASGRWAVGTVAAGDSATLVIRALVADGAAGKAWPNTASLVSLDQVDPNAQNDQATVSPTVQKRRLDVEVAKTVDQTLPPSGSSVTFTVMAINHGPGAATNVLVSDTLPAGLTLSVATPSVGTYSASTRLWTIPSIAAGDTARLAMGTTVNANPGASVTNRAWLAGVAQADTVAANNADSVTVQVPLSTPPVVTILAPADGANFDPGDTIQFTASATDAEDGDLDSSIVWTSDRNGTIGTGSTLSIFTLSPGPHTIAATVTDQSGTTRADTIHVVLAIVGTPTSLNVPYGGTASLPISLSAPAPAGGLALTVASDNTGVADPTTTSLTIPAGALSANATIQGVLPGTTVIRVTSVGYGSDSTAVSVTAALNILQASLTFPQTVTGAFTVRLESQGTPTAAPAAGLQVTLTPRNAACVSVTSPVTIPAGQVQANATASYGGSAATQCNSYVVASAPSVQPDSFLVYVNPTPAINTSGGGVGSGLQYGSSVSLGYAQHGGVTVHLQSSDSTRLRLSASTTTPGTASLDVLVPNGNTSFSYYAQGMEGIVGPDTVMVTAAAPGFTGATVQWIVSRGMLAIYGLTTSETTFSPDDAFYVRVGLSDNCCNGVNGQAIRAGGTALTATITLSDSTAGTLRDATGASAGTQTVTIPVGQFDSPTSVASGGVAFHPMAAGATDVSATISGFAQRPLAVQTITVSAPTITVNKATVGSGLQVASAVQLAASQHGGVTVHIQSADSTRLLIAPDATTPGTGAIDVAVPNGTTSVPYYAQGVEGAGSPVNDTVAVTAAAPGFTLGSGKWAVEAAKFAIYGLTTSETTFSPDDAFYVAVGINDNCCNGVSSQPIRSGGKAATVTLTSSDPTVGALKNAAGQSGGTQTVSIAVGQYDSPTSVAAGGVALDPLAAGSTTVTASIPGYVARPLGSQTVNVSAPNMSVSSGTVGGGLILAGSVSLGASGHGGVTVHLQSRDPSLVRLSADAVTPGTGSIDVSVPDGTGSFSFWVQGVEGVADAGNVIDTVAVTAPGFNPSQAVWTVEQPKIAIYGLTTSQTTFSPDDPFYVYVGIADNCCNGVSAQSIRPGGTPAVVRFTSSVPAVAQFTTSTGSGGTASVTVPVGTYLSPTTVAAGGVALDPLSAGSTTVTATATGYAQRPLAIQTVTVSSPTIVVSTGTVGSGLQTSGNINLGAAQHGGVTVHIASSAPGVLLVSPDANTPGTASIDVAVPNGTSGLTYYVQGVEGQTGTASVTASAPGFIDGGNAWTVVQPGVVITGLSSSTTTTSADDAFYAWIGIPSGTGVTTQALRAGATAVTVTLTSGAPAVGALTTTVGSSGTATVQIAAGQYQSVTGGGTVAGGVSFHPLSVGSTMVAVAIPGFVTQPAGVVVVVVN
jgi:uncharacterized repeat protein (TIGR01451 family)